MVAEAASIPFSNAAAWFTLPTIPVDSTVTAGRYCPLCGGCGRYFGTKDGYPLRVCDCEGETLLSWPYRSQAEYEALYTDGERYHRDCQLQEHQRPMVEREAEYRTAAIARLKQLRLFKPPDGTPLLDIGTGTGQFVETAHFVFNYDAHGIEPNRAMVEYAASQGRCVTQGSWQDVTGQWGVLCLHDVFEHLLAPHECLLHLRERMLSDALLVIEIPEWAGPHDTGLASRHVRPLQHPVLYSDESARAMFRRAGLIVEAMIRPKRATLAKVCYYLSR